MYYTIPGQYPRYQCPPLPIQSQVAAMYEFQTTGRLIPIIPLMTLPVLLLLLASRKIRPSKDLAHFDPGLVHVRDTRSC